MSKYINAIPSDIQESLGWMLDYIDKGKSLLDIGCSSGYFGAFLKEYNGLSVDGVEISEDAKEALKRLDNVYSFDIERDWPSNITSNSYDYVLIGDVLEHLVDPTTTLKKVRRVLKKNGLLFVSIPNIAHISTRLELMQGSFQYEETGLLDNTHLRFFTISTIGEMIEQAGFSVTAVDYSTDDYPESVTRKILASVGLKPNREFWKMTEGIEARAFQYKLVLSPAQNTSKLLSDKVFKPLPEKPTQLRESFITDLQSQVSNIDAHAKEQAIIIEEKDKRIKNLERELRIFSKLSKPIKKIVPKKLKRALKSYSRNRKS